MINLFNTFNFKVGKRETITNFILNKIVEKKGFTLLPTSLNDLASVDFDLSLKKSYQKISFCVTDGMPLVWFFNFKKLIKKEKLTAERVYGPELMRDVLVNGNKNTNHFFYGSSQETLLSLENNIKKIAPQTKVLELISPPFRNLTLAEEAMYILKIRKSQADVLWIGLSSPKQVVLAGRWSKFLPGVAIMCVGAAFDFLAEKKVMAPDLIKSTGFEWLFRLLIEPKRLWKRYLVVIPRFLFKKFYFLFFS